MNLDTNEDKKKENTNQKKSREGSFIKISISLDVETLNTLDEVVKLLKTSRSHFIRSLITHQTNNIYDDDYVDTYRSNLISMLELHREKTI